MSTRRAVFDWLRAVMRDPDLGSATKVVAWSLAEHATANAVAWPKVEAIGESVGLDISSARRHISALRTAAYLVVEDRRHMREASWYWLALAGDLVGDFSHPPKPRTTARNRLVETGDLDRARLPAARESRPRNSASHDRARLPATTAQGCAVTPITGPIDPPIEPPIACARGFDADGPGGEPRVRGALVAGYQRRYEARYQQPWMSASKSASDIDIVSRWCCATDEPLQAVEDVLDGAFADSWLGSDGRRVPWGSIARDPGRVADAGKGTHAERKAKHLADVKRQLERAKNADDPALTAALQAEYDDIIWGPVEAKTGAVPLPEASARGHGADRSGEASARALRGILGAIG